MSFMEKPFEALVTSARTTGQTVLDKDGKLKMALHNLVPTDLTHADWASSGVAVAVGGAGPSGKDAYLLTEDASAGKHRIYDGVPVVIGNTYSTVYDVKANGRDLVIRGHAASFGAFEWLFDLTAITATQVIAGTNDSATIALISDGWYRCVLTAEAIGSSGQNMYLELANAGSTSYAGDGVSGVYLSRPRVYQSAVHAPAELVPNGTFPVDTSDWTAVSNATLALNANRLHITSHTGFTLGVGSTPISTVVGETYVLSVDTILGTSAAHQVWVGTSNINAAIHDSGNISATTAYTVMFTATQATHYINLVAVDDGGTSMFDNVTCVQVLDDGMQLATDGTDFLETTDGPVYHLGRAYDANGAVLGSQHFEGRTNTKVKSNDFTDASYVATSLGVTPNVAVSVDGTVNATKITPVAASAQHKFRVSSTGSALMTVTVYAKAAGYKHLVLVRSGASHNAIFDLSAGTVVSAPTLNLVGGDHTLVGASIEHVGNSIYRCTYTQSQASIIDIGVNDDANTTAVLAAYTGDGTSGIEIYGYQEETGGFATPYIPTQTSAVARGADDAYLLTSSFGYRADEGTVIVEFTMTGDLNNEYVFSLDNEAETDRMRGYVDGSGDLRAIVVAASVVQATMDTLANPVVGVASKLAAGYKTNDFAVSGDGLTADTDSAGVMPTVSVLRLGKPASASGYLNGYIKRFGYWPTRFANSILESESA